ncbi:ATP-binding protein [Marinomonas sp. 42_23_T18]|nr:ATP-binding protein [Marinomonas sp. 42_23_T18]
MPKRYFKKYIPQPDKLKNNKILALLGNKIYDQDLWHLNRKSVAKAFLNGLFWAALPMPLQMLAAALFAIPLKANIPLSIALVWISNPITMPFLFYCNYLIGTLIVGSNHASDFQLSIEWIWSKLEHIWLPLYVGSLITGIISGIVGYLTILILWRHKVNKRWNARKLRTKKKH